MNLASTLCCMSSGCAQCSECEVLTMQVVEWTPQNDLLGDSRVKAFVTHGGLNSIYEVN